MIVRRLLFALLVLGAGDAALAVPQPRIEARWSQLWRWREIPAPDALHEPRVIRASPAGGFLVLFENGLARYDAEGWHRFEGGADLRTQGKQDLQPIGQGALVSCRKGVYYLEERGAARLVIERARTEPRTNLAIGPQGGVWIAKGATIYRLSPGGATPECATPEPVRPGTVLGRDAQGAFWWARRAQVRCRREGTWKRMELSPPADHGPVFDRILTGAHRTWMLARPTAVPAPLLHLAGARVRPVELPEGVRTITAGGRMPDGNCFFLSDAGQPILRDDSGWRPLPRAGAGSEPLAQLSFGANRMVLSLAVGGKLRLCDLGADRWRVYSTTRAGLGSMVTSITPSARGGIWVGTDTGIAYFDGDHFSEVHVEAAGVRLSVITALYEDRRGDLWIGSGAGFRGLVRFDGRRFYRHLEPEGTGGANVHAIRPGRGNDIWFLMLDRGPDWTRVGGAALLRNGRWAHFTMQDGLPSNRCYDLCPAPEGGVFLGTARGVVRFFEGHWTDLGHPPRRSRTFAIHVDGCGVLWTGSRSMGPDFRDARGWHATEISRGAAGFYEDEKEGFLWCTNDRGLFVRRGGAFHDVSAEPGAPARTFWPIVPDGRGGLWLGSMGSGLIHYRREDHAPPETTLPAGRRGAQGGLEFDWTVHDPWEVTSRGWIRTRWRMNGGAWSPLSTRRSLYLHDAGPGHYRIEVQAVDLTGNFEPEPAVMTITIPTPLWARPLLWVAALVPLLLAGLVALRSLRLRRKAEAQVREQEARMRLIAKHSSELLYVQSVPDGEYLYVSPSCKRLVGYGPEEFARRSGELVIEDHPASRGFRRTARLVLRGELDPIPPYTVALRHRDGGVRIFQIHETRARDRDRPVVLGVTVDVTEIHHARDALLHAEKLASLGVLASGIAHDFNNLLTGVMGNAELLAGELPEDSPAGRNLSLISTAARRAADLCRQLLAYAGETRHARTPVDLTAVVEETIELLSGSFPARVEVRKRLQAGLPPTCGDPTQIRQVVMNLLTNAVEALGEASGHVDVTTGRVHAGRRELDRLRIGRDLKEGDYLFLDVADEGCGMEPEVLARLFDPFFSTKFLGRGLGLAATSGIVKSHGGGLLVESVPGRGTRFRLLLPLRPA